MNVYQTISAVMGELASAGIAKNKKNAQQGYAFRGIDDIYNALARLLATHGLTILPRVTHREVVERESRQGQALFYVTLTVEYDLVAGDGSKHTCTVVGEAMDSADKATNKAMSAAYKYLCLQVFCIPTEGDNDADATTHEVAAAKPSQTGPKPKPAQAGANPALSLADSLTEALNACQSMAELQACWSTLVYPKRAQLGEQYRGLELLKDAKKKELS